MGLMLGGAMKPNLDGDDRPAGPQMILGGGAIRAGDSGGQGATLASYSGQVPDYVMGADWKRAAAGQYPSAAVPAAANSDVRDEAQAPAVVFTRAAYDDAPPPPPRDRYPSLSGPAVHAPVGQAVDDADEAPIIAG